VKATRLLLVAGLLACGDRAPTGVNPKALLFPPSLPVWGGGLVRCAPLPADSVSQEIGPLGGVLEIGSDRLSIPPGALDAPVEITAIAPSDTVNRVRFEPQGLTFRAPVSLTMGYANCGALASLVPKRVAYTDGALTILELVPSIDDLLARAVTARLKHFSDYAIAW